MRSALREIGLVLTLTAFAVSPSRAQAPAAPTRDDIVNALSQFDTGPELDIAALKPKIAERLVRYANLVGRENVLAGTDCGLGTRVGHPSICWAKFEAMAEGARRATKTLWGRA